MNVKHGTESLIESDEYFDLLQDILQMECHMVCSTKKWMR